MATDLLSDILDGLSQEERRIYALAADTVSIDDRDTADLLKFMAAISNQINYYNVANQIDGDWEGFFTSDINVLIVLISRFDLSAHLAKYDQIESAIYTAAGDEETIAAFKELFEFILDIALLMIQLYDKLKKAQNHNHITTELLSVLEGFSDELISIRYYNYQARKLFGESVKIDIPFNAYQPVDQDKKIEIENIFGTGDDLKENIFHALPHLRKMFVNIRSKYNHYLGITTFYIKNHSLVNASYKPHLALCIAFLHLYEHLRQEINQLPKKHLDFYYRQILGMKMKPAKPDRVFLVFEPEMNIRQVKLNAGEKLIAEVPSRETPFYFSLDNDLTVSAATVAELKTLLVGQYTQTSPDTGKQITAMQPYKKQYAVMQPGAITKQLLPIESWPILGEDQYEMSAESRTMDNAETGLMIASPVLYLPDGKRAIYLKFHIETESFKQLVFWFADFSTATGKDVHVAAYELLSDAFLIDFTAINGWQTLKSHSVTLDYTDKTLEIKIELNADDAAVSSYNSLVHGGNYDIRWPVFRLMLNNYAMYNPFVFLKNKQVERITIRADVNGSKAVKLQNSIGALSAVNAFQPFGPQPILGSYLDIKNTNIFNRYTKGFCISLDWIGLPQDPGGWETYYQAYNNNINNQSFKVTLSTPVQGRQKQRVQQQVYSLFETERDSNGAEVLSDVTNITGVDVKRLTFLNKPLLEQENLLSDPYFTDGFVRLELSDPPDGFGHQSFSRVFLDISLHNAGKYRKKLPIPNVPYVPLVKGISIDYTLEHSEVLAASASDTDNAIKTVYLCPFGYMAGYPESSRVPYPLMPVFEMENNLYLGMRNVLPRQELSLLFKLEEKNFSEIDETPEALTWSYLRDNTWVAFPKKDILHDATGNFTHTGIVRLIAPLDIVTDNTLFTSGLFWIRAAISGKSDIKARVIGIFPNATTATRFIGQDNPVKDEPVLPPGAIKSFANKVKGIENIWQEFTSFNGRPAETDAQYYIRTSERLRHKQRLLTARDIEQAVLEEFPDLLMVKSVKEEGDELLNHDCLKVILIPKEQTNGLFVSATPKVDLATLYRVRDFLEDKISPFIKIKVENPVYEKIKLVFKVKFNGDTSLDYGMYIGRLHDDIKEYFCPWLYAAGSVFKVGTEIYIADLLNFLKRKSYISAITGFSVIHFFSEKDDDNGECFTRMRDYANEPGDFVKGSVPEAVLIPSDNHLIEIMDELEYAAPEKVGIGKLAVANELLVSDSQRHEEPETPVVRQEFFNLIISHLSD